ncbi:hypothetical protein CJ030_MR8G028474 [Morella rubra]|uniref:BAH domain-containing protein n=1 Tax=Morella rubra TaxID=262757 RepID=A0A6A1UX92_9ROSI|nr:hypothetical protein CJ030_MR8G028473 [Morella rubra]KAB1204419.1 hypothetical protein CJ030_MR8G028474 [Morella rubra]
MLFMIVFTPCIGKIIKIRETRDKTKKVKVLWFFRPCKISDYLEGEGTAKNELFLASGEGVGLTTINPLDSRNTQPSDEELQQADFIFYRGFDVGHLRILDEIQEKVAGIEVRFMFNRVDVQNPVVLEFDSEEKEVGGNTMASNGTEVLSEQNPSEESNNSRDYFRIQTF